MAKNIFKEALNKSFLFKLTCRTSLFLASFLVVLFSFYLSGNFQNFLVSTLLFVLFLCSLDSIALFLFSLAGIFESIVLFFIQKKKRYWIYFFVFILSAILTAAVFLVARSLSILTMGTE